MTIYQDQLLGTPGQVYVYQEPIIGGVNYTFAAFGASNGGTLLDPAIAITDSSNNLIAYEYDDFLFGQDPFIQFTPAFSDVYNIYVWDEANTTGTFTLVAEPSGPPIFFS